jgi:hypothetical protein
VINCRLCIMPLPTLRFTRQQGLFTADGAGEAEFERPADQPVSPPVGIQFRLPEPSVLPQNVGVPRAPVPEAPVHEYRPLARC